MTKLTHRLIREIVNWRYHESFAKAFFWQIESEQSMKYWYRFNPFPR